MIPIPTRVCIISYYNITLYLEPTIYGTMKNI